MAITGQQIQLVQRLAVKARRDAFDVLKLAFPAQRRPLAQIIAPSKDPRFFTIKCSRRSGKTSLAALALLHVATRRKAVRCLYVALTRVYAKDLLWDLLLEFNEKYQLGGVPNIVELKLRFENGSSISLVGANNEKEIRKIKGKKFALAIVDEFHIFPAYGRALVDEALAPATAELNAPIVLLWTPPPALVGPAVESWNSPSYLKFEWTLAQNPYFKEQAGKTAAQWIKDECKRRGVSIDDPIIQREAFGVLVEDPDSLAYVYAKAVNDFKSLPEWTTSILGVDIGWNDSDAVAALVWDENGNGDCYLAEDETKDHQTDRDLATMLKRFIAKYDPIKIMVDTAGNRKTFESVRDQLRREGIITRMEPRPIIPQADQVGLVNDSLRSGRLRVKATSTFAADCKRVTWKDGVQGGKLAKNPHSDAIPAATNALLAALPILPNHQEPPTPEDELQAKRDELAQAKADRMRKAAAQVKKPKDEDGFDMSGEDEEFDDADAW